MKVDPAVERETRPAEQLWHARKEVLARAPDVGPTLFAEGP